MEQIRDIWTYDRNVSLDGLAALICGIRDMLFDRLNPHTERDL